MGSAEAWSETSGNGRRVEARTLPVEKIRRGMSLHQLRMKTTMEGRVDLEGRSSHGSNLLLFMQGCSSVVTSSRKTVSGGSRRLPADRHIGPRNFFPPSPDFNRPATRGL